MEGRRGRRVVGGKLLMMSWLMLPGDTQERNAHGSAASAVGLWELSAFEFYMRRSQYNGAWMRLGML